MSCSFWGNFWLVILLQLILNRVSFWFGCFRLIGFVACYSSRSLQTLVAIIITWQSFQKFNELVSRENKIPYWWFLKYQYLWSASGLLWKQLSIITMVSNVLVWDALYPYTRGSQVFKIENATLFIKYSKPLGSSACQ